jgi:hypothetical protein
VIDVWRFLERSAGLRLKLELDQQKPCSYTLGVALACLPNPMSIL